MTDIAHKKDNYFFDLPVQIYYKTESPVGIKVLVDALMSTERLTTRMPKLLTALTSTQVIGTELLINEIQSGSIWEDFVIRVIFGSEAEMLSFGEKVHDWAGGNAMTAGLIGLGSAIFGGLVVYGVYKAKAIISGNTAKDANNIEINNSIIINAGAEKMNMTSDDLVKIIQASVGNSRAMAKEAVGVIKPAKTENASMYFGGKLDDTPCINEQTMSTLPSDIDIDPPMTHKEYFDVNLDVRSINRDGENGWEALMPPNIKRRVKLTFSDGITYHDIDGKFEFRADVIVHYTPQGKKRTPTPCEIELVRLVENDN